MTRLAMRSQITFGLDAVSYGDDRPYMDLMKYTVNNGHERWHDTVDGFAACESYLGTLGGTGWLTEVGGLITGHTYFITVLAGNQGGFGSPNDLNTSIKTGEITIEWSGWASVNVFGAGITGPGTSWITPADGGSHSTTFTITDAATDLVIQVKKESGNTTTVGDLTMHHTAWNTEWARGDIFAPDWVAKIGAIGIHRWMDYMRCVKFGTAADERYGFLPFVDDVGYFGRLTDRCWYAVPPQLLGKLASLTGAYIWPECTSRMTPACMLAYAQAAYDYMTPAARSNVKVIESAVNEGIWNYLQDFSDSHFHQHWYWAENIINRDENGTVIPKYNFKISTGDNTFQSEPPGIDMSAFNGQRMLLFFNNDNLPSTGITNDMFHIVYCTSGPSADKLYLWKTSPGVDALTLDGPNITYKASSQDCAPSGAAECLIQCWNAFETVFGRSMCIRNMNGQASPGSDLGPSVRAALRYVNPHTYPEKIGGGSSLGQTLAQIVDMISVAPYISDRQGYDVIANNEQNNSDAAWNTMEMIYAEIVSRDTNTILAAVKAGVVTHTGRDDILIGTYEGGIISAGYNAGGDNATEFPWYLAPNLVNNTLKLSSYVYNPAGMSDDLTQYINNRDILYCLALPTDTSAGCTNGHYITVRYKTGSNPPEFFVYKDQATFDAEAPADYQNKDSAQKSIAAPPSGSTKAVNFTVGNAARLKRIASIDGDCGYDFYSLWFRRTREVYVPSLGITYTPFCIAQYTGIGGYKFWNYQGIDQAANLPDGGRLTMWKKIRNLGVGVAGATAR